MKSLTTVLSLFTLLSSLASLATASCQLKGRQDNDNALGPTNLSYFQPVAVATQISSAGPAAVTITVSGTESTIAAGATGTTQVNKYLGIPYAKPPRRWEPASPPDAEEPITPPWEPGTFGHACFQNFGDPENDDLARAIFGEYAAEEESEDCLSLNVYVPAGAETDDRNRPVMFAIHGGGFQQGTSSIVDFAEMAGEQDIVVVSINYRLNIFGFAAPANPGFLDIPPNLGLHDQQLALDWTTKYIGEFGGDPNHIVLWGMSAGAQSVDALLVKDANPQVVGAIMQSGHFSKGNLGRQTSGNFTDRSRHAWVLMLNHLVNEYGCPPNDQIKLRECIRNETTIPGKELRDTVETYGPYIPFPVYDQGATVMDASLGNRRDGGGFQQVPVLSGTSSQEARFLLAGSSNGNWNEQTLATWAATSGISIDDYREYYNQNGISEPFDLATALTTDFAWICTQGQIANLSTAAYGVKNWRYLFDVDTSEAFGGEFSYLGAFHASDSLLMFNNGSSTRDYGDSQREIARNMRALWGNFIRHPEDGPGWPDIAATADDAVMVFGDGGLVQSTSRVVDQSCELFSELYEALKPFVGNWRVSDL